jgi:hypothetical protein
VNGDGILDLVDNYVDVAFGKGGGAFGKPVSYPITPPQRSGPFHVLLADLRNSGRLDIVEQDGANAVSVMLNNGRGIFQDGRLVLVADGAGLPVAADYNGDGKPDLAVTATGQGITILLGTGNSDSLFTTGATIPIANTVYSVVTGDLNGDGVPDLLAAVSAKSGAVMQAYLGDGDGTFTQSSATAVATDGLLVLADFNRDGKLDFATSTGMMAVGNGDGTFQTPVRIVAGAAFNWAAAGDLNGDGWPDLVFTEATSNSIYVLINNQHGGFKQSVISTAAYGQGPYIVVLGDLNGDGILDAAVGFDTDHSSGLGIFFGDGHGGFAYQQTLADALGAVGPIAIQDVNGDGIPDIVFSEFLGSVAVFAGIGNGTFQAPVYFGPAWGSNGMALGNFHGQLQSAGLPDIVVNTFGGVTALLNTGAASH